MQHTFYAVFDDAASAARAVDELQRLDVSRNRVSPEEHDRQLATGSGTKPAAALRWVNPVIHRGPVVPGGELHGGESATRRGAVSGAVAGAVAGVGVGLLLGPAGVAVGPVLGGVIGLAYGAAMGGISTAAGPDPVLEKLAADLQGDQVLLTVEAPDLDLEDEGERVIARHGGAVRHRHFV
jgi:hypothetical protein